MSAQPPTILVIEDNPVTRLLVVSTLRRGGYRVVEGPDGSTGLHLAQAERPQLVLIDILLPDVDGWEIATQLHDDARTAGVPLLALTGCLSKVDEGRLSTSPFSDVVTKPVDAAQLLSTVRAYLPETPTATNGDSLSGRRVLVADDDVVQQKLLIFHLRRLGCDVEGVGDGEEVLAAARRQRPDAVVSDVMMPKLDGFGVCMAMRQDPALAAIPIVLTTNTFLEPADRELGLRAGADAFVMRTPQMVELIASLRGVIERPAARGPQAHSAELSREHAGRILQQLERQVGRNSRLSQHCATLSAELSVLRSISEALSHSDDLEPALRDALITCFDAGGVATGAIVLFDPDGGLRVWTPVDGDVCALAFDTPDRVALLKRLIGADGTSAIALDSVRTPDERELLEREGLQSMLVVPLVHAGGRLGGLVMASKNNGLVARERVLFAEAIANQIAVALTVKRAFETLEGRVEQRTAELAAAQREAERANAAKTSFLSAVSHDLRTPLNAILGFAQLLEMDEITSDQAESVRQILGAGRHLLDLINEVLDITRIEAGQLHLSIETVDTGAAIREALSLIRPLATPRGLTIVDAAGAEPLPVKADRQRLKQILLNLLSNAVKYNRDQGEVTVTRTVTAAGMCRISVRDTGQGIPADKQALLFTPFQRLGAETSGIEGTGLGLSLAHALAQHMQGHLDASSEEGRGSTFSLELPLAVSATVGSPYAMATNAHPDAGPAATGTVLYIEDNVANLRLMQRMLARRAGVTLVHAGTGTRALDLVADAPPDLILLDVQLPDMSGADVLRRLKQAPRSASIPVVVLTADATPELPLQFAAAGATAFLTKPLDVRQMLDVVDSCLAVGR